MENGCTISIQIDITTTSFSWKADKNVQTDQMSAWCGITALTGINHSNRSCPRVNIKWWPVSMLPNIIHNPQCFGIGRCFHSQFTFKVELGKIRNGCVSLEPLGRLLDRSLAFVRWRLFCIQWVSVPTLRSQWLLLTFTTTLRTTFSYPIKEDCRIVLPCFNFF